MRFPHFPTLVFCFLLGLSRVMATDAPYVANTISAKSLLRGGATTTVDLTGTFALTDVTGPLVEFNFSGGTMYMELYPGVAPLTVANFLKYVDNRVYDNTFIHRSIPNFVIQAGGYQVAQNLPHVPTYNPVISEYNLPNVAGTLAMAKVGGDLNSATSEWFVNLVDNPGLDDALDPDGNPQRFTVFGRLIGDGLPFSQSIAALQRINFGSPFDNLPVINYTGTLTYGNLLVLETVKRVPLLSVDSATPGYLTLTATSSDNRVMVPQFTTAGLKLTSGSLSGTATITVVASDNYGQSASTSFTATSITPVYAVSVKASPSSYGVVKGSKTYLAGSRVTVKATPSSKHKFKKWTESGKTVSSRASYTFTVGKRRMLVAVFSN